MSHLYEISVNVVEMNQNSTYHFKLKHLAPDNADLGSQQAREYSLSSTVNVPTQVAIQISGVQWVACVPGAEVEVEGDGEDPVCILVGTRTDDRQHNE